MVDTDEVIADVELHLLNEWHLRNARARRRERARRQQPQPAPTPRPSLALCYIAVSVTFMVLSAVMLMVWG